LWFPSLVTVVVVAVAVVVIQLEPGNELNQRTEEDGECPLLRRLEGASGEQEVDVEETAGLEGD
jgi:hypothetical protein